MKYIILLISIAFKLNQTYAQDMNPKLHKHIQTLESEFSMIEPQRKKELSELSTIIQSSLENRQEAKLVFVCTHNSRRSQLSEIWFRTAVAFYGLSSLYSFSGGTESTAFNHRMVDALRQFGFELEKLTESDNPLYQLKLAGKDAGPKMYSKKYTDSHNPQEGFIAVMVCSDADKNCPLVEGADARFSLPYLDPKSADNTALEQETYMAKVREIGREILYMVSLVKQ